MNSDAEEEDSKDDLNLFEEENKESSKEKIEEENNSLVLKRFQKFRTSLNNRIEESLLKNTFYADFYRSIDLLKITPPPKYLS